MLGVGGGEEEGNEGSGSGSSGSEEEEEEMVPNWQSLKELGERVFERLERRGIDPMQMASPEDMDAPGPWGGGGGLDDEELEEACAKEEQEEVDAAREELEAGMREEVERLAEQRGEKPDAHTQSKAQGEASRRWRGVIDPPKYGGDCSLEGPVWGFGGNCQGALGTGELPEVAEDGESLRNEPVDQYVPTSCRGLRGRGVVCVGAGRGHTVVGCDDGTVWGCGWNDCGQLGLGHTEVGPENYQFRVVPPGEMGSGGGGIRQVVCGDHHTILVLGDGSAWGFGSDEEGQLGLNSGGTVVDRPTRIAFGPTAWPTQEVVAAAAGGGHSVFVLRSGQVFACGRNQDGQLGLGHFSHVERQEDPTPLVTRLLEMRRRQRVPESVRSSDRLVTVGACVVPEEIKLLRKYRRRVLQVACGQDSTLVLLEGSLLLACGANEFSQLGIGIYQTRKCVPHVVPLDCPSPIVSMAVGQYHAFVVLEDLSVWGFGRNDGGQLGMGDVECRFKPERVEALDGAKVRQIVCGEEHSLILLESGDGVGGDVLVCGRHHYGQLGIGVPREDELVLPLYADEGEDVRFFGEYPPVLSPHKHTMLSGRVGWVAAGAHTSFAVPAGQVSLCSTD